MSSKLSFFIKRLFFSIITIYLIATATFFMMHSIPGGPFTREKPVPPAVLKVLEQKYKLNDPLYVQYFDYIKGIFSLNLGPSFQRIGVSVNDIIVDGLPYSAIIGLFSSLIIITLGIPFGIFSALKKNSLVDYCVMFISTIGITVPSFVIGTLIVYFFAGKLNWIPTFGANEPNWFIGPAIALSGFSLAFVARLTRSSMLEVLHQDYIRTARANGIPTYKVLFKYATKNALIPVVTYIGPMVAAIMTGSFVIEKIFVIPGLGKYFVESITSRDYTVLMGVTVFYASFYIFMVLLVDTIYSLLDPRIKL